MKGHSTALILGSMLTTLLFASCSTGGTDSTMSESNIAAPATQLVDEEMQLSKGMDTADIIDRYGLANSIEPLERQGQQFEVWTYKSKTSLYEGMKPTSFDRVLYLDPITGENKEELVPVTQTIRQNLQVVTELLINEGKLLEWKKMVYKTGKSYE